jgi:hypothetical protein
MDGKWFFLWLCATAGAIACWQGWPQLSIWLHDHQELTGWVQAVGSICAILATGWGVHRSHALQERERTRAAHADYTRFLETIFQLVGGSRNVAKKIADYAETIDAASADTLNMMSAEVNALVDAFRRIDITRLDRFDFVNAVVVADAVLRKMAMSFEILKAQAGGKATVTQLAISARGSHDALTKAAEKLEAGIARRGGVVVQDRLPF